MTHEDVARERKANRIFVVLMAHGVDSEEAGFLSEQAWEALAHLAGVNPPSWRTKALVVSLLAQHAEARQRMAAIMDPFDFEVTSCERSLSYVPVAEVEHGRGADIPNFDIDLMRGLTNTVGHDDAFRPIMACHYSEDGCETPCVGYLAQEGYSNLAVRIMAIRGTVDFRAIADACEGLALWESFDAMLAAYEAAWP